MWAGDAEGLWSSIQEKRRIRRYRGRFVQRTKARIAPESDARIAADASSVSVKVMITKAAAATITVG